MRFGYVPREWYDRIGVGGEIIRRPVLPPMVPGGTLAGRELAPQIETVVCPACGEGTRVRPGAGFVECEGCPGVNAPCAEQTFHAVIDEVIA